MTDYVHDVLDELVPRFDSERGDWDRLVGEAGEGGPKVRPRRRRMRGLVVAAAAVVAITLPVVGAASQEWWFFGAGSAPRPVSDVHVVKTGSWEGEPWHLAAYVSADDGICFSLTPTSPSRRAGEGAGLACAWIEGLPTSAPWPDWRRLTITLLAGSGSSLGFPAYIVGPVVERADEVAIHFADGTVLRTPTFDAPNELGSIRFYATQQPEPTRRPGLPPQPSIRKVVGLTSEGEVVACLVVMGHVSYDLSDCA